MNFVKRLCIQYVIIFIIPFVLLIISNINPYFLISSTFGLLVVLFYLLLAVNLFFTILYIITRPRAKIKDYKECFYTKGYKVNICHLCDNYVKCKEISKIKEYRKFLK